MLLSIEESPRGTDPTDAWRDANTACERIPPLWDLENYVAVNPFLGFLPVPMEEAAGVVAEALGARVLPALDFYRDEWRGGGLGPDVVRAAAGRAGIDPGELESVLSDPAHPAAFRTARPIRTAAERGDEANGTGWWPHVLKSVARWCAVFAADGGALWENARQGNGLFASWVDAARVDRSLEIIGIRGWRAFMREVPDDAESAVEAMVLKLDVPPAERVEYFYRLLGSLYGWASWFRRGTWQQGSGQPGAAGELLAILLCADAALGGLAGRSPSRSTEVRVEDESVRLALQDALEDRYVGGVLRSLNPPPARDGFDRPAVQAVFCIDVRSEPLRRHLEAQSSSLETRGFAGFFGVSLDWQPAGRSSARCPVLLKPSLSLQPSSPPVPPAFGAVADHLQSAPSAAFSYVELLGIGYGLKLAGDALLRKGRPREALDQAAGFDLAPGPCGHGMPLADRVELAAGILKNTGLGAGCARLVLLCGHAGHSTNNPHAAGLDCGACGGHGGAINARVAASLLNAPDVRDGLRDRGLALPRDTHFLPAVHDTSTDHVTFLDVERVPPTHAPDVDALRAWVDQAGALVRAERSVGLGVPEAPPPRLARLLRRRSRDWSETRPEWGLARNAAFIAARRARTRGVDLGGRAFLHEYDAGADADGSVLSLILTAPMVVASWINLQYFASTVDNDVFGCGDKALHNRIGSIGVVLGNGGDLRTGLALQSVRAPDGTSCHEPLRLQVVVEAAPAKIDAVLESHRVVRDLVENGWVRLFSLAPDGPSSLRRLPGGGWEEVAP